MKAQGSARYVGSNGKSDAVAGHGEPTLINATSSSVLDWESKPAPDCELLKHKVDEDPRWDFGKINKVFQT